MSQIIKKSLTLAQILTSVGSRCIMMVQQLRCPRMSCTTSIIAFKSVCKENTDAKLSGLQAVVLTKREWFVKYRKRILGIVAWPNNARHAFLEEEKQGSLFARCLEILA